MRTWIGYAAVVLAIAVGFDVDCPCRVAIALISSGGPAV